MFEQEKNEINIRSNNTDQKKLCKQFKKLKHKALYLSEEYEEISEEYDQARSEFISAMFQYCSDKKISSPLSEKSKDKQEEKELPEKTSEETKELYREIVKETHPDKTKDLDKKEIKNRNKLYRAAVEGKKKGDFWGILKAALELDVDFKNISEQFIKDIEQSISNIEKEISKIKADIMYKWYNSNEELKQKIFEQITQNQPKIQE
jgi:hypothetical protein